MTLNDYYSMNLNWNRRFSSEQTNQYDQWFSSRLQNQKLPGAAEEI